MQTHTIKSRQTQNSRLSVQQVILISSRLETLIFFSHKEKKRKGWWMFFSRMCLSVRARCTSLHLGFPCSCWDEPRMCHPIPPECRADLPPLQRRRKEQESIEMNRQPSAGWLRLNGNVKLSTDPLCLFVECPASLGSPNRIIPSLWQSTPHCFHFMSLPLCSAVCTQRGKRMGRGTIENVRQWIEGDVHYVFDL